MINLLAASIALALSPAPADAEIPEAEPARVLEEVTILGARTTPAEAIGAAHVIGHDDLERFKYADVQQVLRQVPGVAVQIEDGFGLRPNISIRGVASERSARVTLLEDGVLIAPAPYAAPSAYYFPTAGRIAAWEVLKGPAAITQGPFTIGGALNMISTPIPNQRQGTVRAEAGEDSTFRVHASYGDRIEGFSYLLETHQWYSDGFQNIDRSATDTGLEKQDYTAKLRFENDPSGDGLYQWVELKLQYADEDSNQSYLGLTDVDLAADPVRRYGLSELDNMATEHEQVMLRYGVELSDATRVVLTAYNNEHQRAWFKTEGIDLDGSTGTGDFSRTGWFNVVQAINTGAGLGAFTPEALQAILDGGDTAPGAIELRNNSREYYARGIQGSLQHAFSWGGSNHELQIGLRWHEDEEDRLQQFSTYTQAGGSLQLADPGTLGNAGNRVQRAEALAFNITDTITFGDWTVAPGLRYEHIDLERDRYFNVPTRTDADFRDSRENSVEVLLPGLGMGYQLNDAVSLVAGVHKGFSAPGNSPGAREEEAWNYELGARFVSGDLVGSVIGFHSDYENLLGVCTASSGTDCEIGDAFNGDAASVLGVEAELAYRWTLANGWTVPLRAAYTWIDAEFDSDIADTDFFGDVSAGDPLPYIPDHRLWSTVGLQNGVWGAYLSVQYVDEVCVRASCGAFETTDSAVLVDLSGEFQVNTDLAVYARIENLTEEDAVLGRQPYGARSYRDRAATLGFTYQF